jgi:serine/threonine protein kinase
MSLKAIPPSTPPRGEFPCVTSPIKPERHPDILHTLIDTYNLPEPVAITILKAVYAAQETLGPKETQTIPPSEIFPNYIAVESRGFHIYAPNTSQGGNGSVFVGPFIATMRMQMGDDLFSPSKPQNVARKVSHRPQKTGYSPIKNNVSKLIEAVSPSKKELIAPIYSASIDKKGIRHMMMPAYPCSFANIKWAEVENPVHYLLSKVGTVCHALAGLHKLGLVHRDVKEGNVMDDERCKLIDFDTLAHTFQEVGFTTGTVDYLNPRSFGNAENTLFHQRERQGLQRRCDDMFALYHMGLNMTLRLCSQLIPPSDQETHQLIAELVKPKIIRPPQNCPNFSIDELRGIGIRYPHRAHFYSRNDSRKIPERIAIFPDVTTYRELLCRITTKLPLSEAEATHLLSFSSFCAEQKFKSDAERSKADSAHTGLTIMLDSLKTSCSASSRKRGASSELDVEVQKRQRKATSLSHDFDENTQIVLPEILTV